MVSNIISTHHATNLVDADSMKLVLKHLLFIGLFIIVFVSVPSHIYVKGEDLELEYDNYIMITVYPNESIIMTLKGSYSNSLSPWEQTPPLKELSLILDVAATEEDLTTIENELHVN